MDLVRAAAAGSLGRVNICRRHGISAGAVSRDQVSDRYASERAFALPDTSRLYTAFGEACKTIIAGSDRFENERSPFGSIHSIAFARERPRHLERLIPKIGSRDSGELKILGVKALICMQPLHRRPRVIIANCAGQPSRADLHTRV